ncbi:hypothetical protein PYW08_004640 [Mythimna loreyi]|uniref:Uncharacterized protein n=1 Tax=Mythimna loreyi TaxID=667449 RepID=A0ACC2QTL7_9NEOP|nr:hypothetical protein PYW08_004640 [Mythimna loreyi]
MDHNSMLKDYVKDLNNNQIDVLEYCSNMSCIEKCCGKDEIIDIMTNNCMNRKKLFKMRRNVAHLDSEINYSTNILSSGDGKNQSKKNFFFVHRDIFNGTAEVGDVEYNIVEDGSLWIKDRSNSKWYNVERLQYCIDYKLVLSEGKTAVKIIIRRITEDMGTMKLIQTIEIVGVAISSICLLFVLLVYSLILDDRKFVDFIMMAYTFSLLLAFTTKLVVTFVIMQPVPPVPPMTFCKIICPVTYFAFLSSICWLTAFAIACFLTFRPFKNQHYSNRSEWRKFKRYSLFALGTPFLLTVIVTVLDNLPNLDIVPPPFQQCFISGLSTDLYYKIPIGILIIINIVIFCITVYNMKKSDKNKKIDIVTFTKLCVMMGVFWFLELLPPVNKVWAYILVNSINLLIGVIIFYLYIGIKKSILQKLCEKLNIQNKRSQERSRSLITSTTGLSSLIFRKTSLNQRQSIEHRLERYTTSIELLRNCPQGENSRVAGEDNIGTPVPTSNNGLADT